MEYKYKGLPLTSTVCRDLILETFKGEVVSRKEVFDGLRKNHLEQGGIDFTAMDKIAVVKKALWIMMENGEAEKTGSLGYWKILGESDASSILDEAPLLEEIEEDLDDKALGSVYAYCYPTYEKLAKLEEQNSFPIKVGFTTNTVEKRIREQTSTGIPEKPKILWTVEHEYPKKIESMIHNILFLRGAQLETYGNEWFETNLNELESIYKTIQELIEL